jgi:hypothetical protein
MGGYEVHFYGQERKERIINGGGVLMNGNRQYLQHGSRRGEFCGDSGGVANGDRREERNTNRNRNAPDGGRLQPDQSTGYELR